jgi:hypothetical protein
MMASFWTIRLLSREMTMISCEWRDLGNPLEIDAEERSADPLVRSDST